MKRVVALILLLGSLGILAKFVVKRPEVPAPAPSASSPAPSPLEQAPADRLVAKYPAQADLVRRVVEKYQHNALAIEKSDGLRGLAVLDRLDLEAVYLYDQHPADFRRLCSLVGDQAAAEILLNWKEYLGFKHAEEQDRRLLLTEIGRLNTPQRRAASRHPEALPLLLTDPAGMADLIDRYESDPERLDQALAILSFVRLDEGPAPLRVALRAFDTHGDLVLDATRLMGLDGLALTALHGEILDELGESVPLADALIALKVNAAYIDDRLRAQPADSLAREIRHVASEGVLPLAAASPHGLQLVAEFGAEGVEALRNTGPDAADLVYQDYSDEELRRSAVRAMADHGAPALAVLAKYADDGDFREILRKYGPEVLPPVIQADFGPELLAHLKAKSNRSKMETLALGIAYVSRESGQGTIRTIRAEGLDRVHSLAAADGVAYYELLPLYDILHLGNTVRRGYTPTRGELTWAALDGAFVVMDALSIVAMQPQGAAASELARAELKAAAREATETLGQAVVRQASSTARRDLGRQGADAAGESVEHAARSWLVRGAGGVFEVMRRFPEAVNRLSLPELARVGRPLSERAGIRLTTWQPLRFVRDGQFVTLPIPAQVGLRRIGLESGQAGIGWVALHKMEEHLASRRPGESPFPRSDSL